MNCRLTGAAGRKGRRLRLEEDGPCGGGTGGRLETRQGAGIRHPDPRRGWLVRAGRARLKTRDSAETPLDSRGPKWNQIWNNIRTYSDQSGPYGSLLRFMVARQKEQSHGTTVSIAHPPVSSPAGAAERRKGRGSCRAVHAAGRGSGLHHPHGWIPFPALRAAGDDTNGGAGWGGLCERRCSKRAASSSPPLRGRWPGGSEGGARRGTRCALRSKSSAHRLASGECCGQPPLSSSPPPGGRGRGVLCG
jgi:hypothetical protein